MVEDMNGIAAALVAIDKTVRDATGNSEQPVGYGVHYLLDHLAVSTLGTPRTKFKATDAEPQPAEAPGDQPRATSP